MVDKRKPLFASREQIREMDKAKKKSPLHAGPETMGVGSSDDKGFTSTEADFDKSVSKTYDKKTGMVTETFKKDGKTYTTKYPIEDALRRGEDLKANLPRKVNKKGGSVTKSKYSKGGGVRATKYKI
jgi:hypothetical protein